MAAKDTYIAVETPPLASGSPAPENSQQKPKPASRKSPATSGRKLGRKALLAINFGSVAAGLGAWTALSAAGVVGLPGPVEVLIRAGEVFADGTLAEDTGASLARVLSGFLLGSLLAVPVGFLMGWYQVGRAIIEPWVQFFRTIPPLALLPLVMVTMGIGETPKIFVIFLAAFLSCVISTYQGVVSVDKTLINAARVLGADSMIIFRRVVVPASSPFILVGMRIGLGAGWATVVAAELIAAPNGLGMRMQQAQQFYDMPTILVNVIVIGILGLLMDRLLLMIEAHLTRWQERR
ncbi:MULTISPECIES: ABC transporter permease [Arthrobacter]|uniref:ABC transporter permease n=1 Tax=Arthrobacter psychrochitiniphilus TaxID=291045 RepID=A0A2V3DQ18_9MICC|nr:MULTISPECIES: ABC transporter permease [Arthrobacter]NYG16971.1 NitT/TauT family transport system permease protein [Arthrobacter psychrochitiniphilus]PXA64801.1 ABC transporter permease [Arthrobacter psychrochitiniphilus]